MSGGNTDKSSSLCSSSSSTPIQACAACKYQRRRCNPNCALAPYFPADNERQFLNARRLFGVSNMLKIIENVHPTQRSDAMNTIIFQSNVRACDPVGGSYRIVKELEMQCEYFSTELAVVMHQVRMHRYQQRQMMSMMQNVDDAVYVNNLTMAKQLQQQQCYDYVYFDGNDFDGNEDVMSNIHIQSNYNDNAAIISKNVNNNNDNNVGTINGNGNEVDNESMLRLQHQHPHEVDVEPLMDYLYHNSLGDEWGGGGGGEGRDHIKDLYDKCIGDECRRGGDGRDYIKDLYDECRGGGGDGRDHIKDLYDKCFEVDEWIRGGGGGGGGDGRVHIKDL